MHRTLTAIALIALATPLAAKESLGVFSGWGAFRDAQGPRCYAIAMAEPSTLQREFQPFAAIGNWPQQSVRNQVNFRLSRSLHKDSTITLRIDGKTHSLTGSGSNAWARDKAMDATIVAAMRSARTMAVRATDAKGRRFSSTYTLAGAASAMDAATVACARKPGPNGKAKGKK